MKNSLTVPCSTRLLEEEVVTRTEGPVTIYRDHIVHTEAFLTADVQNHAAYFVIIFFIMSNYLVKSERLQESEIAYQVHDFWCASGQTIKY